jgi:drug/metabolite transporter (DMT)-like permease
MALSIVFLGEKVGIRRWTAAAVSFCGVLLVVRPGTGGFSYAALFPLASAIAGAASTVITRRLLADSAETTMLWTAVIGLITSTVLAAPAASVPSVYEVVCGLLTGLMFAVGQLLVVTAYRMTPVSILAPFSYAQMLSAGLFSYMFFSVLPNSWTIAGSVIIAASGIYSANRERIKAADRT